MDLNQKIERYEGFVDILRTFGRRGSSDAVLRLVNEVAAFAEMRHAGIFADGRLENPAYAVGRSLDERTLPAPRGFRRRGPRRILHVCTDVPDIGGHTRTALNWIRNDRRSTHSVVITGRMLSPSLRAAAQASGGTVTFLTGSLQEKARQLRAIARSGFDLVVLTVWNRDVVPIVAFAADNLPPVAVHNHADHLFWLGSSITDSVVNLRPVGAALSRDRRLVRHNSLTAIPLVDPLERCSKVSARQGLGIPESQLMLTSVGRGVKYKPDATHDFFRSAKAILNRYREAHLYVVGPTEAEARSYSTHAVHDRLHVVGPQSDATLFQAAADIYVESFPFGSQTACLEACMCGVAPVLSHTPESLLLTTSDDCIGTVVKNADSEAEHEALVSRLIESPAARRELGAEVRRLVLGHHTGDGWRASLEAVYARLLGHEHRHGPIPEEPCRRERYDQVLAEWLDAQASAPLPPVEPQGVVKQRVGELAWNFRQRGAYGDAFWMLESYRRGAGLTLDHALAAGKLGPHWFLNAARRAVGTR